MNPIRWKLHWQIALSLTLSVVFACVLMPAIEGSFSNSVNSFSRFIGELFLNALKMMIVPLIVASIISGVMHLGAERGVGRWAQSHHIGSKMIIQAPDGVWTRCGLKSAVPAPTTAPTPAPTAVTPPASATAAWLGSAV